MSYTAQKQLMEQRRQLIEEARQILNRAAQEKRVLATEEQERYDRMYADIETMTADIERHQKLAALGESAGRLVSDLATPADPELRTEDPAKLQSRAFDNLLRRGMSKLVAEEQRALNATTDANGGYTFAPEDFRSMLIKAIDNSVFMRQLSTVIQLTSSDTLGAPSLSADPADPSWTAETTSVGEDSTMAFGKRNLTPNMLSKLIKVSQRLLNVSTLSPAQLVADRFAYKFAVTLENGYLNGAGTTEPLGIFTASASGVPTSRDVATGNTSSAVTMDGLMNAIYSLKAGYRKSPSAAFIGHRDLIKMVSKLRDDSGAGAGTGAYVWEPSVVVGEPDRIKGIRVYESEYAPSTFTTGLYVAVIGDLKYYWIADLAGFSIQRLDELYAGTNQVGFIGRMESDGAPVLGEAFARVKLG